MYCGHCGNAVGENDAFCNSCGARFIDASAATLAPPAVGTGAAGVGGAAAATAAWSAAPVDATTVMPTAPGPAPLPPPGSPPFEGPPTEFVPLSPGPGGPRWRPFAIGAVFALIVVAGIVAYFALRGDETSAEPDPSGPSVLAATTTTSSLPPVSTTLPATTAPPTVAPTVAANRPRP